MFEKNLFLPRDNSSTYIEALAVKYNKRKKDVEKTRHVKVFKIQTLFFFFN